MKKRTYLGVLALGAAMLAGAGCQKNSDTGTPATNSVSGEMPATNGIINNTPRAEMTNTPAITNSMPAR
jgi:hypothetical protein